MENKYYTPEISEFHAGFDYEEFTDWIEQNNSIGTWGKKITTPHENLGYIQNILSKNEIRVKLLDREDIESLGFNYKGGKNNTLYVFTINLERYFKIIICFKTNKVEVTMEDFKFNPDNKITLFFGKIKNKSELQKLMKQLGIL